jgi:hypothetical protein
MADLGAKVPKPDGQKLGLIIRGHPDVFTLRGTGNGGDTVELVRAPPPAAERSLSVGAPLSAVRSPSPGTRFTGSATAPALPPPAALADPSPNDGTEEATAIAFGRHLLANPAIVARCSSKPQFYTELGRRRPLVADAAAHPRGRSCPGRGAWRRLGTYSAPEFPSGSVGVTCASRQS